MEWGHGRAETMITGAMTGDIVLPTNCTQKETKKAQIE